MSGRFRPSTARRKAERGHGAVREVNRPLNLPQSERVEIRPLALDEVGEAMRLKAYAGWNQTEDDWRRLLKLNPRGCFAAAARKRLVGTATTTTYGRGLAWVGMVLVDPEFRRRGVATRLVRAALDHLGAAGTATMKLDATPDGSPVYRALGFEAELRIERWSGVADPGGGDATPLLEIADPSAVLDFDARAFGADRSDLLRSLFGGACVAPLARVTPEGRVRGYALARRGAEAFYVGPVVATDLETASALLDGALARLAGRPVYVDLNTTFAGGAEVLSARGFVRRRELIRMSSGEASGAGTSDAVFAIAGPEYG
jgi:GNAT superfamily N-acetyltransferase